MEKQKRPLLLAGLVCNIVGLAVTSVIMLLGVLMIGELIELMLTGTSAEAQIGIITTITTILIVALIALAVLALIFSAIGIKRTKLSPQEFAGKKGMLIASVVLTCLVTAYMLFSIITAFDVLSFLIVLTLLTGVILTIVGICQNKQLLNQPQQTQEEKVEE